MIGYLYLPKTVVKKLFISDLDSTIISIETIDEFAKIFNKEKEVSCLTKLAMEGKLNFKQALVKRVSLLKGLKIDCCNEVIKKTSYCLGAKTLLKI